MHPATIGKALSLMLLTNTVSAFDLIAHRGASYDAPENTLAAVRLAWEQKSDGVEIDVHLTRNGYLAVIHDPDTKRTTGVPGSVATHTLESLKQLDAGKWKAPAFAGQTIPTLGEVLTASKDIGPVFIELKGGPELIPKLVACLKRTEAPAVIIGFDFDTVTAAKKHLPTTKVFWLVDYKNEPWWRPKPKLAAIVSKARKAGLDGLNLSRKWPLTRKDVAQIHSAGLEVWVWTVDDPDEVRRLRDAGVNGLTTNRPGWMREQIRLAPPDSRP